LSVFLISGAGSGIGAETARTVALTGHTVILLGRNFEKLVSVKSTLANSASHSLIQADIRKKAEVQAGLKKSGLEKLDGVIANAGVGGDNRYGSADRWQEIIDTNLTGAYILVNECLPYLQKGDSEFRHILLISSILARLGAPGYSAYCASKAGLLGLMRSWASALASQKILVNAVCPGWVDTEMARSGIAGYAAHTGKSYDEALQEQMALVPLGKMSEPKEIAALITFLVSNQQQSITGQTFDINNGALMPS